MKILFVCRGLPHAQARDSGRLDTYYYLEALSQSHAVSLIAYVPDEEAGFVPSLEALCDQVVAVPFFEGRIGDRLRRLFFRQLFTRVYGRVYSAAYKRALQQLIATHAFDLVILDGMMGLYTRWIQGPKLILDEVDIFSHMAYQEVVNSDSPLQRLHLWQDWLRTVHRENLFLNRVDAAWVRSQKDRFILNDLHPHLPVHVIQPWFEGLDTLRSIPAERPSGNKILFVGAMNLFTNIRAAIFFGRHVFPIIQSRIPDAEFLIVGSHPADEVKRLAEQNRAIIVTGEVPDLTPYYETCAVCVVPLFIGGGIIVKTLNGLAAGRPVVATQVGNSGTGAIEDEHLIISALTPEPFANHVVELLENPTKWRRLATSGRELIQQNFDWHHSIEKLNRFITTLLLQKPNSEANKPD